VNANAIRKPTNPQIRELDTAELDVVAGGRWVRMLQNWWWVSGDGKPVKGPPA